MNLQELREAFDSKTSIETQNVAFAKSHSGEEEDEASAHENLSQEDGDTHIKMEEQNISPLPTHTAETVSKSGLESHLGTKSEPGFKARLKVWTKQTVNNKFFIGMISFLVIYKLLADDLKMLFLNK